MKTMKHILAFALILMLALSLCVPAYADDAAYDFTEDFLAGAANEPGLEYELEGLDDNKTEVVSLTYSGDLSDYVSYFFAFFASDGETVLLYMPNVITFEEDDLADILIYVNELNAASTGVKLYVDTDAYTVDAELYLLTTPETAGSIALVGSGELVAFTDDIFELLGEYNTAA